MESIREHDVRRLTDLYLDSLLQDLPSEAELEQEQVLSKRFLKRMDRLVKREAHRTAYTWKRLFLVAAIIGLVLATATGVYANRTVVFRLIATAYHEFTSIIFPQPFDTERLVDNAISDTLPGKIPHGYRLKDKQVLKGLFHATYVNAAGQEILFTRSDKSGLQVSIDTEGALVENVDVNGYSGIFYAKNGQSSLVWADERYAYMASGAITKQEMIDLAKSTK